MSAGRHRAGSGRAGSGRARAGLLRNRPYRTLWLGQSVSSVGDAATPVALTFALISDGRGRVSDIGVVLAVLTLSQLALLLTGGAWADRVDRVTAMIGSDLVRGLSQLSIAAILLRGGGSVWTFAVAAASYGAASAFFKPAATALLPQVAPPGRLQEANALLSLTRKAIAVGVPVVAGAAVLAVGAGTVYLFDGLTFLANVLMLRRLRGMHGLSVGGRPPRARLQLRREIGAGWLEVRRRPWLAATIAAMSVANLSTSMFVVITPALLVPHPGGVTQWGIVLGASAAGAAGGGVLALRYRPSRPLLACLLCLVPLALQLLVLAYLRVVVVLVVVRFLAMVTVFFSNAVWASVLQRRVPSEVLGRVSSFDWLGSVASVPAGNLLAAQALATGTTNLTLTVVALAILGTCGMAMRSSSIRTLDATDSAPPAEAPTATTADADSPADVKRPQVRLSG